MKFSREEMLIFYHEFNSMALKYQIPDSFTKEQIKCLQKILDDEEFNEIIEDYKQDVSQKIKEYLISNLAKIDHHENIMNLTKVDFGDMFGDVRQVYNYDDNTNGELINLFFMIREKVLGSYISIEGIERLLDSKYIQFEWDMHLEANFSKHDMKYYRDHFYHQFRNAYSMHKLIESKEWDIYNKIEEIFSIENTSKVSKYVQYYLQRQNSIITNPYEKAIVYLDDKFYMRNIIYMSSYMAALFHDIAYPITHYLRMNNKMSSYIASSHYFSNNTIRFNAIFSLLQNSLLFRVVELDEIKSRLNVDHPEHGAISAVVFLLHFYENGAIFTLPPYKVAALEMAALAIYNHTNKYAIQEGITSKYKYRPIFKKNPISYLLRIVDDLQEWDRIYFEVSQNSNVLICQKCHTPLINITPKVNTEEDCIQTNVYQCNCEQVKQIENNIFERLFDGDKAISYRRVYTVTVCDSISIYPRTSFSKANAGFIILDYDLFKMLNVSLLNSSYAYYRIKELNGISMLLENQGEFPKFYLKYFVSPNPILIKVMMLEQYYEKVLKINDLEIDIDQKIQHVGDEIQCIIMNSYETLHVREYILYSFELYLKLYRLMLMFREEQKGQTLDKNVVCELMKTIQDTYGKSFEIKCLLEDCFSQFYRGVSNGEKDSQQLRNNLCSLKKEKGLESEYEYIYVTSDEYLMTALSNFIDNRSYRKILNEKEKFKVDAFTDLYLFKLFDEGMKCQ